MARNRIYALCVSKLQHDTDIVRYYGVILYYLQILAERARDIKRQCASLIIGTRDITEYY